MRYLWSRAQGPLLILVLLLAVMSWPKEANAGQLSMTWEDNSNNEQGFKIERKTGQTGTLAQINTVSANVQSYTDSGLTEGTTYCYRVRAFNAGGDSAYSNEDCGTAVTTGGGGADGGGAGCFIAAAAYGSPLAEEVEVLRAFRDRALLTHAPGRLLVAAYYRLSPPLARVIAANEPLRAATRGVLWPLVLGAQWALAAPALALTLGGGALMVGLLLLLRPRARRRRAWALERTE